MLSLALLFTVVAQDSEPPRPPSPVEPQQETVVVEGKVREVAGGPGGRPQALLIAGAQRYVLQAEDPGLRGELRRLSGLVVEVEGVLGAPQAGSTSHLVVGGYTILEVGKGIKPRVGQLALRDVEGARRLVFVDDKGKADLLPKGWSKRLHRHAGAKVWMVGTHAADGTFRPQRFSILRTASKRRSRPRPPRGGAGQ